VHRVPTRGPRLAAQVSHCWRKLSTSILSCRQQYRCLCPGLSWHPDVPQNILYGAVPAFISTYSGVGLFGLSWTVHRLTSSDASVRCLSIPGSSSSSSNCLTWDFVSRRSQRSASCRISLTSLWSSSFPLRAARSQPFAAVVGITYTSKLTKCLSRFWQWTQAFGFCLLDSESALTCFSPWWCSDARYTLGDVWRRGPSLLSGSWNKWASSKRSGGYVGGIIVYRRICENVSTSSQCQITPFPDSPASDIGALRREGNIARQISETVLNRTYVQINFLS
jgi:hypothetical protein